MDIYNIEDQYQLYLQKIGLSESNMHPVQKEQIKLTFYGAFSQLMILLEDNIAELEDDKAFQVLEGFKTQIANFFLSQTANKN
jgi:hypothetical protein